jgi:hypothetical protein
MARRPVPALARVALVAVGVVIVQALLMLWFAWPAEKAAPHAVPLVVAGPAAATTPLARQLSDGGKFEVTQLSDAAAADAALRHRDAYAAFVVGPDGVALHVASAASPTLAQLLSQQAQQLHPGTPVPVTDVVASPPDDPRGTGLISAFLPLLLTCVAAGVALLFAVRAHLARLVGVLLFAVLAGALAAGVMHGLGLLTGSYWAAAGAIGLLALAVSGTVSGLGALLGNPGIGLGVLAVFLVGNPISGLTSAPQLLPEPWGAVGQWLAPGAGATLLRSVAFFDGAGATRALLALALWAAFGLACTATGHFRDRTASRPAATAVERAPVPA